MLIYIRKYLNVFSMEVISYFTLLTLSPDKNFYSVIFRKEAVPSGLVLLLLHYKNSD